MVETIMTQILSPIFKTLSASLLLTTVLGSGVMAQSLPDISPEQLAQDVEKRYNDETGETEYIAGSFDPFEGDDTLAGSAFLRTSDTATTIDGRIVSGGAVLEIGTIYTTSSPDSYDIRGFQTAEFISGQPVNVIRYNNKTLDCSRDSQAITYSDDYYRGASYGYIAGLYRIFPRYRGHRDYGWHRNQWQRGRDTGWRRTYRPGRDGDWRRRPDRDTDDRGHPGRRHDDGDVTRRRPRSGDDGVTPRRPRTGDGDGTRRRPNGGNDDVTRRRPRTPDGDITRRGPRTGGDTPTPRRPRAATDTGKERPPVSRRSPNIQSATGTPAAVTRPERPRRSAPAVPSPRSVAPRPVAPRPVAPRPEASRPQASSPPTYSPPKSAPPPVSRPRPKPQPTNINRAVDQTFKSRNPRETRSKKHRDFYPMVGGYTRTDVYTSYRCVKEETLSVHIPQDRLNAARFDGFTVILLDNAGRDVPVFIPPNYVEGFRIAVGLKTAPTYAPESTDPRRSPSNAPIIYGDPGYPQ